MTTTPHRDCTHPATKAARAACRKARAAQVVSLTATIDALIDDYNAGVDIEEIAAQAPRDIAQGYYDGSLDIEEFIAALRDAR
jgi:hypothetical protein